METRLYLLIPVILGVRLALKTAGFEVANLFLSEILDEPTAPYLPTLSKPGAEFGFNIWLYSFCLFLLKVFDDCKHSGGWDREGGLLTQHTLWSLYLRTFFSFQESLLGKSCCMEFVPHENSIKPPSWYHPLLTWENNHHPNAILHTRWKDFQHDHRTLFPLQKPNHFRKSSMSIQPEPPYYRSVRLWFEIRQKEKDLLPFSKERKLCNPFIIFIKLSRHWSTICIQHHASLMVLPLLTILNKFWIEELRNLTFHSQTFPGRFSSTKVRESHKSFIVIYHKFIPPR